MSAKPVAIGPQDGNQLLFNADEFVNAWVRKRLGWDLRDGRAIGVMRDGQLIAGWVYHRTWPHAWELSVASTDPRWLSKKTLKIMFGYPFSQGCERLQCLTVRGNKRARKVMERLGFKYEGMARKMGPNREDLACYSIMSDECNWYVKPEVENGK